MPRKDLTNKKFNHWTVLYPDTNNKDKKHTYWICQCDCEEKTIKSVRTDGLTSGKSKSCGCENRKLAAERMQKIGKNKEVKIDLTGKDFGYWHVIDRAENQNGHVAWNCVCKCGTKRAVLRQSLTSGVSQSCGCMNYSHGEFAIIKILQMNNIPFVKEYVIDLYFKSKNNKARFDFFVENKYFIEFDGIQHFQETSFHHGTLEERQEYDALKNQWCKEHNIPLIRIPYTHLENLTIKDLLLETTQWRVV